MNGHTIAMWTNSGLTVINRREIAAMTRVEEDDSYDTLEIHMRSGTIFCTKDESVIESLWYVGDWGINHQKEEEE